MLEDEALVVAARSGSHAAFRAIVERHRARLFGVAYALVRDRILAEDIAQETLLVAWRDLGELRETERLAGWLAGIARNLVRGAIRRSVRCASALRSLAVAPAAAPTPHDEAEASEEQALLARGLRTIPDTLRRPLLLHYMEGRTVREVAWDLTLSETAVKQRLLRGRAELRSFASRAASTCG